MVNMIEQIPLWFYLITSTVYTSSAIIGFLVSYFAFRSYRMTKNKSHLFLFLSFLLIGLGFVALSSTSIYIYTTLQLYRGSSISLNLVNYLGFRTYYILSAIGYVLLTLIYLPKKIMDKLFILYVPIWYASSFNFHVFSIVLVLFVMIQSIINSIRKKNLNSYLVTIAFVCLLIFHLLLLLTSFSQSMYLTANIFLILGFLSLLTMLIRVSIK
jgi:hypothetical protein